MSAHKSLTPRERLSARVSVQVAGQQRVLRFTMDAMAAIDSQVTTGSLDRLLLLLWAMLRHDQPGLCIETLSDRLDYYTEASRISEAVSECLGMSVARDAGPSAHKKDKAEAADWPKIWSYARYELRLSDDEFWSLTPLQFSLLSDRHEERRVLDLHGSAIVASVVANANRDAKKQPRPFTPADFLPDLKRADKRREEVHAVRDLRERSREIFAMFGEQHIRVEPTLPFLT